MTYYEWNKENVENSPNRPGVYMLFNAQRQLIYIGMSQNSIRDRLLGYFNSNFKDDPCKKVTMFYDREPCENPNKRELELLQLFRNSNRVLPICNDKVS